MSYGKLVTKFKDSSIVTSLISSCHFSGAEGIEPSRHGVKVHCLTTWLRPIQLHVFFHTTKVSLKDVIYDRAGIAQLVEQWTEDPRVTSSSLVPGTKEGG